MSTYENLHGRRVNVVSSNPSNPKDGEVWYNSTLGLLLRKTSYSQLQRLTFKKLNMC